MADFEAANDPIRYRISPSGPRWERCQEPLSSPRVHPDPSISPSEAWVGRPHAEWLASVRDAGITILFTHLYVTGQNKHGAQTDVTISIRCVAYPASLRKIVRGGGIENKVWAGCRTMGEVDIVTARSRHIHSSRQRRKGPFASYVTASLPRTPLACQMDSSSTREGGSEGDTKVYDVPFISDGSIWKHNDVAGIHCQIGARGDVNCFAP